MSASEMIDFHTHYIDPAWLPDGPPAGTALARLWRELTDLDAQLAAQAVNGVDARVLSAPVSMLAPSGSVPDGLRRRVNETWTADPRALPAT